MGAAGIDGRGRVVPRVRPAAADDAASWRGRRGQWKGLLLAYGAGQLAADLPITPGGLGVVEGSLTIALVACPCHRDRAGIAPDGTRGCTAA